MTETKKRNYNKFHGSQKSNYDLNDEIDNNIISNSYNEENKKKASFNRVLLYYDINYPPYYAEESEAIKILKILDYLKKFKKKFGDRWCPAVDIYKDLKMPRTTFMPIIKTLSGVRRIEYQDEQGVNKIIFNSISRIIIKKDSYNKARNIRKKLTHLKAPIMIKLPIGNLSPS